MRAASDKADASGFLRRQYEFAAHIRDPQRHPAPADVEDRRMRIYRELLYNNVEGFLRNAFPVLHKLTPESQWRALVRDFFARHQSRTPLFLEIPREFLMYLEQERGERPEDPPFLLELAHYEWVELALSVAEDPLANAAVDADADMLDRTPVLSPLAWPLSYRFPVHKISPAVQPAQAGNEPTRLLVYRTRDDAVRFIELNAVSARLLGLLVEDNKMSASSALRRIADELQHPDAETVIRGGMEILNEWRLLGIVLGSVPADR